MEGGRSMRNLKPETSKKNPYHVSKHRMYELMHFCLQYPEWKKFCSGTDELYFKSPNLDKIKTITNEPSDPTAELAMKRMRCYENMKLVEDIAYKADEVLANYILLAVTEDLRYETIKSRLNIPCGRDMFYDRRRRFFWLLDKER